MGASVHSFSTNIMGQFFHAVSLVFLTKREKKREKERKRRRKEGKKKRKEENGKKKGQFGLFLVIYAATTDTV